MPANIQQVGTIHLPGGLFGDFGECIGAIIFSIPPTRWTEDILELSRMVRHSDFKFPLSCFIALSCNWLRKSGADLVISFADPTYGHSGVVYKAAGWSYFGQRKASMDGVLINGTFVPGRSCNSKWGTRSPTKLAAMLRTEVHPSFDLGKHLFWKSLGKKGSAKAQRLGLLGIK